jgi:CMD domain protein
MTSADLAPDSIPDLVDRLVGLAPGDRLDAVRCERPAARANAQASFDALFASADVSEASLAERFAVAYWTAALSGSPVVAGEFRASLEQEAPLVLAAIDDELPRATSTGPYGHYPPGPLSSEDVDGPVFAASERLRDAVGARIAAALEHAHLLTYHIRDASPEALEALLAAGWSITGIVTISQLVAFVAFQLRLVAGLAVLKEAR